MKNGSRILLLTSALGLIACGGRTVTRPPKGIEINLSGQWNDSDAKLVVDAMTTQMFKSTWATDFRRSEGRNPVVKLSVVLKRTKDRNINADFFTRQLQAKMLASGAVDIVAASGQERINELECMRQAETASDRTACSLQDETGADFTLQTIINSQDDRADGKVLWSYLVENQIVDVRSQRVPWIGQETIRKYIE